MSVILKNDWVATGNNPKARRDADWRNAVSAALNLANIPSGGTVELTPTGLQIEVDSDDGVPVNLTAFADGDGIRLHGGSLWRYTTATPVRAGVLDGGFARVTAEEGSAIVIATGAYPTSATTFIYVEQTTAGGVPDTTGGYLKPTATTGAVTYTDNRFLVAVVVFDAASVPTIYNALDGDLHFAGTSLDGISLDTNSDGAAQIYDFDGNSSAGSMTGFEAIPMKTFGPPNALDWYSASALLDYISSNIDFPTYLGVDNESIDWDGSDLEIKGWAGATATSPVSTAALIPVRPSDIDPVVDFYSILDILAAGNFWEQSADNATNYGTAIGNGSATKVIDLNARTLTGDWSCDGATGFDVTTGDYYHASTQGVTGDGFSGGIKTDDAEMRAAIESQVQDVLAGVGGLL